MCSIAHKIFLSAQKPRECLAVLQKAAIQEKKGKAAPNEAAAQAVGSWRCHLQLKGKILMRLVGQLLPVSIHFSHISEGF